MPWENRKNIARMALSPNATLLITVDVEGRALLVNYPRRVVLHHHFFGGPVTDVQFSPDGKLFIVTQNKEVQVWKSPGFHREFAPFVLLKTFSKHYDEVVTISWNADSKRFLTTSKDMTVRLWNLGLLENELVDEAWTPVVLQGHRETVVAAFWSKDNRTVYSVSKDGALFVWRYESKKEAQLEGWDSDTDDEAEKRLRTDTSTHIQEQARWRIINRHYFNQNHATVQCATFHQPSNLLIVGFSSGIFGLWELPEFSNIHTLSISQKKIDSVAVNPTGEWLAFGSSKLGQLLVWEWQSETYVLKQQGHYYDLNTLGYSTDGQHLASGGDDGKVKIWNTTSGFCYVTFSDHSSGVTKVEFAKTGQVVFSASLDGTVRAYDLIRYRNFRTFTSPQPAQFGSMAVDPSGEVVCAGSLDSFEIFVWSVQTGKLLDILTGHSGPVSSLAFDPTGSGRLLSGSWDKTLRVWDIFGRTLYSESMEHGHEVLAVAFRPDGKQVAASTSDGQISLWDPAEGLQQGGMDGRRDVGGGRKAGDFRTTETSSTGKSFDSLCYSADGSCILAGGSSKYVCIYDVRSKVLLKKFEISRNLSLDGMLEKLNSKLLSDAGALDMIDDVPDDEDLEDRLGTSLPGVQKGDASLRKTLPEIRLKEVRFAPTGRSWSAAGTEGLVVYSLDDTLAFDPFDLEIDITPDSVLEFSRDGLHLKALVMAFRLGERSVIDAVFSHVPSDEILLVSKDIPIKYLDRMLKYLVTVLEQSPRVEYAMLWAVNLLKNHARHYKDNANLYGSMLRGVQKGMSRLQDDLSKTYV
jgi:periodic tryptophan protein 2